MIRSEQLFVTPPTDTAVPMPSEYPEDDPTSVYAPAGSDKVNTPLASVVAVPVAVAFGRLADGAEWSCAYALIVTFEIVEFVRTFTALHVIVPFDPEVGGSGSVGTVTV
jgi:hypothetical protein